MLESPCRQHRGEVAEWSNALVSKTSRGVTPSRVRIPPSPLMKFILIYTTHKSFDDAQKITDYLLHEKLIACVNFYPITSQYRWKGAIETASETVAILKTRIERWDAVKKYIEAHHPYETPCILKLAEVEANDSYASWIHEETA
jgi:periplasmic divalent cation tolerance protein